MKRLFFIIIAFGLLTGCAGLGLNLEDQAGPPPIPPPPAGTAADLATGTDTTPKSWSAKILSDTYSGASAEIVDAAVGSAS